MKSKLATIIRFPWYVIFLSIYPILTFYAHNESETNVVNLWRPLAVSLGGGLACLLLLRLLLKDWYRAALVTALLAVMFFAYGHVYNSLKYIPHLAPFIRHRWIFPIWLALTGFIAWLAGRKASKPAGLTMYLNVVGLVAIAFPLVQMATYSSRAARAQTEFIPSTLPGLSLPAGQSAPDIYYIILDAYGNTPTLNDLIGYDNTELLNRLRAQGFYVADCSQSNYAYTRPSLVSSLNMNYLDTFGNAFLPEKDNSASYALYLKENTTRISLEKLGYKTVAFETGFTWSEWKDADLYLSPQHWQGLNDFETIFVQTSALRAVFDLSSEITPVTSSPHRERVLYTLGMLPKLPSVTGPKFVFAHIIIPHDPFDVGVNGQYVDSPVTTNREDYYAGYRRQVTYVSKVITDITAAILANSSTPPIIVIQGDHGPWNFNVATQRLGILNAYYLPQGANQLYTSITPVNTFRIVFNTYFGAQLPLLEDVSYMSDASDMTRVTPVANPCLQK